MKKPKLKPNEAESAKLAVRYIAVLARVQDEARL